MLLQHSLTTNLLSLQISCNSYTVSRIQNFAEVKNLARWKGVTFGCQFIKGSVAFLLLFLWITCPRGSQLPFVRTHNVCVLWIYGVMESSMDWEIKGSCQQLCNKSCERGSSSPSQVFRKLQPRLIVRLQSHGRLWARTDAKSSASLCTNATLNLETEFWVE